MCATPLVPVVMLTKCGHGTHKSCLFGVKLINACTSTEFRLLFIIYLNLWTNPTCDLAPVDRFLTDFSHIQLVYEGRPYPLSPNNENIHVCEKRLLSHETVSRSNSPYCKTSRL